MNCSGSGLNARRITDDGMAYVPEDTMNKSQPALGIRSAELVVRFPRGECFVCLGNYATDTKGIIRNHTPRGNA